MRLGVIACGAPLASRTGDLVQAARSAGWEVVLTLTTAATNWAPDLVSQPPSRDLDALIVCPLTFNTATKWALGISDTSWLGVLNELLAADLPIVAVPMVNETLWQHPAWEGTIARLRESGVLLVDPASGDSTPRPVAHGSGADLASAFNPGWALSLLA